MVKAKKKMISTSGARTRRHELCDLGLAKATGQKKRNAKGGLCMIWRATTEEDWKKSEEHSQLGLDDVISERTAVARRSDPQTSWDAARSVKMIRDSQRKIYNLLVEYGPMIDEEIYGKLVGGYQFRLV